MAAFRIFSRLADLLDIKATRAAKAWIRLNEDGTVTERTAAETLVDLGALDAANTSEGGHGAADYGKLAVFSGTFSIDVSGFINIGGSGGIQTAYLGSITTREGGYISTGAGGLISTEGSGLIYFGDDGQRTVLAGTATSNVALAFPNASGTLARVEDIPASIPPAAHDHTRFHDGFDALLEAGNGYAFNLQGGYNTTAPANYAFAYGYSCTASGNSSVALGRSCTASGQASFAVGMGSVASGVYSIAGGRSASATAYYTVALGYRAKANHDGALVLTDSQNADQTSSTTDQATLRFANGFRFLGGAADFQTTPTVGGSAVALASDTVPTTRTINGYDLSANRTLTASDVGAATAAQGAKADTALQPGDAMPNPNCVWLKNTTALLAARGAGGLYPPVHEFIMGDSIATGFETVSKFPGQPLVGYKISPWYQNIVGTITATNTAGTNDFTKWINGVIYKCPVGSTSDWFPTWATALRADRIGVGYLQGTGSFTVQYSLDGGTWTTAGTVDTSLVVGAGYAQYTISNANQQTVKVRITSVTTAQVELIGVGYWMETQGGVVQSICNMSGATPDSVLTCGAATLQAIMAAIKPTVIITAWNDPTSVWDIGGTFDQIVSRVEGGWASVDWLLVSGNPFNPAIGAEAISLAARSAQKEWALRNYESYIDGYSLFRSYANAIEGGWMTLGDDYHLTDAGKAFRNRYIRQILGSAFDAQAGGCGIQLSKDVGIRHVSANTGSVVEIGPWDNQNAAVSAGLFLRGGNASNGLRLGSRSSSALAESATVYWSGTNVGENLKFAVFSAVHANDFLAFTTTGNTTSGRCAMTTLYPLAMTIKRSTGADPANPAAGNVTLFTRLNGSSKMELCCRFPTGDVRVIETEL